MRTKHYLKVTIMAMVITMSLPLNGQNISKIHDAAKTNLTTVEINAMPDVITVDRNTLPGIKPDRAKFTFNPPDTRYYTVKRQGNISTYIKKPNLRQIGTKNIEGLDTRDSVNVTIILDYDKENMTTPSVCFYNIKDDDIHDPQIDNQNDTLIFRVPIDTFDIRSDAWTTRGILTHVIKELVSIQHDTIIVFNQSEAKPIPVFAYDEKGTKLVPYLFRYIDNAPYTEVVKEGNIYNGFLLQSLALKGLGVIQAHLKEGLFNHVEDDSLQWNQGQIFTYWINKVSDRYSLVVTPSIVYNDHELFAGKLSYDSVSNSVINKPEDGIVYSEDFQPTPLGNNIGKHGIGFYAASTYNGVSLLYTDIMIDAPADNGNKVTLHLCAPKEYGSSSDAFDVPVNLSFGDMQVMSVQSSESEDDSGNIVVEADTTYSYTPTYGESFIQSKDVKGVEYFNYGHGIFGSHLFEIRPDNSSSVLPGNKAFSTPSDKRRGIYGNNTPILSMMLQNYYLEDLPGKVFFWFPAYIGRLGEVRTTDDTFSHLVAQYNGSTVYETDTVGLSDNFSYQWIFAQHADGAWKLTLTDNNVMVDSIQGKNVATITYDQRKEDWTPPTLQMLNFINADSTITDRFASPSEGTLQFAGGDFNYIFDAETYTGYFDCQPMTVKVEYSPYNEDKWADFDVEEDPSLYTMPAFGYFYRGQLSQVRGNSSNGWFDLRITLTDESGNTQQQVISPAFKIESLTAISSVNADNARTTDGRIYDLQGRAVTHPAHGIYIKDGKKFVVK